MNFDKRSFILAASLVLASGAAFAQAPATEAPAHHKSRDHGRSGRMAAALNLTDAQKEHAKTIREKYRAGHTDVRTQMRDLHTRAEAAKQANNTAELERIKQDRQSVFAKTKESWDAERAELRTILTAEQQAKFDEMPQRKRQHRDR